MISTMADTVFYFIYMAVSSTLIPLPTPPAVLAAGILIGPLLAALVGGVANCIGATIDYWVGAKIPHSEKHSERFNKIEPLLHKFKDNAFLALVIAGFTPFIFDPLRLAAGYIGYDLKKYWIAVFIGRTPRFFLVAWMGQDVWSLIRGVFF